MKKVKMVRKGIVAISFLLLVCSCKTHTIYEYCGKVVTSKEIRHMPDEYIIYFRDTSNNEVIKARVYSGEWNMVEQGDTIKCN